MYLLTLCQFSVKLHCNCHWNKWLAMFLLLFVFLFFHDLYVYCFLQAFIVSTILKSFNFIHSHQMLSITSLHLAYARMKNGFRESIIHFGCLVPDGIIFGHLWTNKCEKLNIRVNMIYRISHLFMLRRAVILQPNGVWQWDEQRKYHEWINICFFFKCWFRISWLRIERKSINWCVNTICTHSKILKVWKTVVWTLASS